MTCKNCLHEDLCMDKFKKQYPSYANKNITVDDCNHFKNKADFVEVVRCKDCKHWWKINRLCIHPKCCEGLVAITEAQPNHFCSYGERKDVNGKDKVKG